MRQRLPRLAVGIGAATCSLLALWPWAQSSPVGSSPDEGFHLVSIWCGPDELIVDCKEDLSNPPNYLVPGLLGEPWLCFYGRPDQSAGCQAENTAGRRLSTANFNTTQYPPHYYDVARNFASEDIGSSVLGIRRANALVGVMTIALALALHARRSWVLAMLLLALAVPLAMFFIPSVNPTGLAISGVAAFTLSATSLVQRQESLRSLIAPAVMLIVSSAISFGSRRDAVAYCALVGFFVVGLDAFSRLNRDSSIRSILGSTLRRPAAFLITVVSALLALSFVVSGIGSVVTSGLDGYVEGRDSLTVLIFNLVELPAFFGGFFSGPGWGLGWLDTPMPIIVPLGAFAAMLALLVPLMKTRPTADRAIFVALLAVIATLALAPLQADLRYVGETVQPRYLYPLFVASVLLVAARSSARPRTSVVVMASAALIVSHSVALRTNIRRYTTGLDVRSWRLDEPLEWWWSSGPSATTTWIVGSVAFASAVALCAIGDRLFDTATPRVSDPVA